MTQANRQEWILTSWSNAAAGYNDTVHAELSGFKAAAWLDLIHRQLSPQRTMHILDIGTGPGFFTVLLGREGHRLTGIDCSPAMIAQAENNAAGAGVKAHFAVMDSHRLEFPDRCFDVLICRNVVWTLYDPAAAYRDWKRVLKPGGRLLVFDANWHLYQFDARIMEDVAQRESAYRIRYGDLPDAYYGTLNKRDEKTRLPLHDQNRPSWDHGALSALGFVNITSDPDITGRVWDERARLLYGATPLFMISAGIPETPLR